MTRHRRTVPILAPAFAATLLLALSVVAGAQTFTPVPVGGPLLLRETQIEPDSSTTDSFDPSFAGRPGGGFLAGWSRVTSDATPDEIQVQAYNHIDREVGPTRAVSDPPDAPADAQRNLALDSSNGRAVAVWADGGGPEPMIDVRFLNSAGQPTSPQIVAGTGSGGRQPAVAIAPSGVTLVVWTRFENPDFELAGRIFDAQGNPLTGELDIDGGVDVTDAASVGVDDDGNFLIAWDDSFLLDSVVHARWIDSAGQTVVPTFDVGGPYAGDPAVSVAPDGRAVVTWSSCNDSQARTEPCSVFFRLLGSDGLPDGAPVRLNPLDGRAHERPAVGVAETGDFAVAWRACSLNPFGARFDCLVTTSFHAPDGSRYGNRLQMPRNGEPTRFTVVPLGHDFVVGWFRFSCDASSCDPGFESVYAQRYRLIEIAAGGDDEPDLVPEIPDGAPVLSSPDFPDFRFWVRIGRPGADLFGAQEPVCLPETICVSGALPGRTEVQLRIIGPRPNGFLWPTVVKFTTSTVEVWIEQISTGDVQYYGLEGATQGSSELPGFFDRTGFQP